MKILSLVKRLTVATVAAAALAGPVTSAHAVLFNQGDAILALYGNDMEYLRNLGSYQTLISNGLSSIDLSSALTQVSGPNATDPTLPVKFEVFGGNGNEIFFGDRDALSKWTSNNINAIDPLTLKGGLTTWSDALISAGQTTNPSFFNKTNNLSFSINFNSSGNNSLGGTLPPVRPGFAEIGSPLNLFTKASPLAQVGVATLDGNGMFQISAAPAPVPVPAAAVLFASGLVGLVGLARRRMSGTRQDAA